MIYKSAEGQREFIAWYENKLRDVPFTSRMIQDTHILEAGDATNPALILLPGTNFSALAWREFLEPLSQHFHVIAVDVPGQPGKSNPERLPFRSEKYADWLAGLLDALRIERAHLAGHSLGGWLALKLAVCYPERANKLVLIDPAGIIRLAITPYVMAKVMPFALFPDERSSRGLLSVLTVHEPSHEQIEWMMLVGKHVKSSLAPPALSENALRQIQSDILLLSGKKDVFLPPEKLQQRAGEVFRKVQIEILPGAGHMLLDEQPRPVVEKMLSFLK